MLLPVADAVSTIDSSAILPAISTIGSLSFAVWYAWFVTTKSMPDQQREHRDQVERIIASHEKMVFGIVADHREDVDKLGQQYDRWFRTVAGKRCDPEKE